MVLPCPLILAFLDCIQYALLCLGFFRILRSCIASHQVEAVMVKLQAVHGHTFQTQMENIRQACSWHDISAIDEGVYRQTTQGAVGQWTDHRWRCIGKTSHLRTSTQGRNP